jgi:hypothetical protein
MIYYFAPFHTRTDMGSYLRDPSTYMTVMHLVYEDIGPWDIYYNINPFSRFMYSFIAMMRALWPGIELPEDSVVQIDEIEYMHKGDYDEILSWNPRWARFFGDTAFRLKMLPRFCQEAQGQSGSEVLFHMLVDILRQWIFWMKDFAWWKKKGAAIQIGYVAEMPFDTFSQGRNVINFSKDLFAMPDKIGAAATKLAESYAMFSIIASKLLSVPRVQLFLHRTSNSFISPRQFEALAFPSIEIVVNRLVDSGITPMLHCDGDWLKNLKILRRLPAKKCILQLDGLTDIFRAKEEIGDHMCLFGDVPASMLVTGSPQEVEEYCHKLIENVGRGGGFILGAGCEIPSNARAENLRTMVSSVRKYGYYR